MPALIVLPAVAGCAPTINLVQPDSPRFEGRFAPEPPPARPAGAIRVVTFNVKLSEAVDRAIEVLESRDLAGADVIALQEMDEVGAERIARALGMNYVFFPAVIHPTRHRYFGPAVLARWPIDSAWKVLLPHAGSARGQRRTATAARVLIGDLPIRVYAVHLEVQTRLSPSQYVDQAAAVVEDAAGSPDPVVVAGDFNGYDIGRYLEARGYRWPTQRVGRTSFLFSLDHIFTRGLDVPDSASAGSVHDVLGASDHFPVWARFLVPVRAVAGGHPLGGLLQTSRRSPWWLAGPSRAGAGPPDPPQLP